LLDPEMADVDGNTEQRNETISVFNGPPPALRSFRTAAEEASAVGEWIGSQLRAGILPHECGLFVRSDRQLDRAREAALAAAAEFRVLDEQVEITSGRISIGTMHLAKGLEFRVVAVMACDDEVIPLQERIEAVGEDSDLKEVYDTERQLLYVACTRARDALLVTGVDPPSEFLADLRN
jgi:superfamily I DNA/RNA helicase